jgi:mRNA-degrading endonuclease RelE of RelBE toxin-antitoxin system
MLKTNSMAREPDFIPLVMWERLSYNVGRMKKTFIESSEFTDWVWRYLDDDAYATFQQSLLKAPHRGVVIPGCGGLRKIRLADSRRGKGKRGGARVIYLHVPEVDWIFLLDIYSKDEKDGLTVDEKKLLRRLAERFRSEAISGRKRKGDK